MVFGAALSGGPARPRSSQQAGVSQSLLWPAVAASLIHMGKHTSTSYVKVAPPRPHKRSRASQMSAYMKVKRCFAPQKDGPGASRTRLPLKLRQSEAASEQRPPCVRDVAGFTQQLPTGTHG